MRKRNNLTRRNFLTTALTAGGVVVMGSPFAKRLSTLLRRETPPQKTIQEQVNTPQRQGFSEKSYREETELERKLYQTERDISFAVIHHTASERGSASSIDQAHRARGWDAIGYHVVISKDGTIEYGEDYGRPVSKQGAHCKGKNVGSIGIAMIGNFEITSPTQAQLDSLYQVLNTIKDKYHLTRDKFYGHRELKATLCPGKNINIKEIRENLK